MGKSNSVRFSKVAAKGQGDLFARQANLELDGRRIVVIGGTTGIGADLAYRLELAGAKTLVVGRTATDATDGSAVDRVSCDITNEAEVERLLLVLNNLEHPLDGLVLSAGVYSGGSISEVSTDAFRMLLDVNVVSHYNLLHRIVKAGLLADGASIVFLSSILAVRGAKNTAAYSATKGAIAAFTRALAAELASSHIRVNSVSPSFVETRMTEQLLSSDDERARIAEDHPLGRLGTPEDVSEAILFLLSNRSGWMTGTDVRLDGGRSHVI